MAVELDGERLAGVVVARDVRQEGARVDVDGVPARRLEDRHAGRGDALAEVLHRGVAILLVGEIERLVEADRDRFEVASGQPAVGRKALGQDEQLLLVPRHGVVVGAQEAADVGHAVLLRAHRAAVGEREHLARDVEEREVGEARLARLDEVGVLGEAAGVEIERHAARAGRSPRRRAGWPSRPAGRRRRCW